MTESLALPFESLSLGTQLSLSSPPLYTFAMPPQPISNDSGNHVFREEINKYTVEGTKYPENDARWFVLRESPRQQISRLDKQNHSVAWNHWQEGMYPSNYEVREPS